MAQAREAVTNDFPTPPFPLTIPITFPMAEYAFNSSKNEVVPPLLGHPSQLSLEQLPALLHVSDSDMIKRSSISFFL
jgi:hypothetical protein